MTETWRKSSYSGGQGNCIEVGTPDGTIAVRDTKDRPGPVLRFTPAAWRRFAERVKERRSLAGSPSGQQAARLSRPRRR
jgi:hypothetical protein